MPGPRSTRSIVSTSEGEHLAPILAAIELGKPVLVEKPIALTLDEADQVLHAIDRHGANVHVGYSRRYKERYLIAKEQILKGRIGTLIGGAARVFNSRSQALAILERNPHATPVVDALTYYVDLMNWLLDGKRIVEVYARGQTGVLKGLGHDVTDLSYAVFTYDDGTVVNLGVCYALPEKYPALGHAARVEVLGTEGVMILDDDHTDQLMYSEKGVPHVYLPDHSSTWCSSRAARRATGRWGNSGGRSPTKRAHGSITWPWASPVPWRRRSRRARPSRRPWRSNIRWPPEMPVTLPLGDKNFFVEQAASRERRG